MKKIAIAVLGFLFFLSLSGPATAGAEEAKAAYMRGMSLEKNKQYGDAIKQYQAALDAAPNYFYAHKQMGTCYYYLGDKSAALYHYDAYLAKAPNDMAIKKIAEKLRASGVSPAAPIEASAQSTGPNNALYTNVGSLFLGVINLGYTRAISDHNAGLVEAAYASFALGTTHYALTGGGLGWHFSTRRLAGWFIGPKVNYFTVTATDTSTPGVTLSATGSALGIGGEGGFQWRWDNGFMLNLGVGVQSLTIDVAAYASSGSSSASASGSYSGVIPSGALNIGYAF